MCVCVSVCVSVCFAMLEIVVVGTTKSSEEGSSCQMCVMLAAVSFDSLFTLVWPTTGAIFRSYLSIAFLFSMARMDFQYNYY